MKLQEKSRGQSTCSSKAGKLDLDSARTRIAGAKFNLNGWIGNYLSAVSEQWLKVAPFSNPAMLEMFRDRDREPKRELLVGPGAIARTR